MYCKLYGEKKLNKMNITRGVVTRVWKKASEYDPSITPAQVDTVLRELENLAEKEHEFYVKERRN